MYFTCYSVSPKREALLQSCDLSDILQAYTSIIVACNKFEMNNINYISWAANGWQPMVWIRCTINWQQLKDRHNDRFWHYKQCTMRWHVMVYQNIYFMYHIIQHKVISCENFHFLEKTKVFWQQKQVDILISKSQALQILLLP